VRNHKKIITYIQGNELYIPSSALVDFPFTLDSQEITITKIITIQKFKNVQFVKLIEIINLIFNKLKQHTYYNEKLSKLFGIHSKGITEYLSSSYEIYNILYTIIKNYNEPSWYKILKADDVNIFDPCAIIVLKNSNLHNLLEKISKKIKTTNIFKHANIITIYFRKTLNSQRKIY
jgi:hypothetical protein